MAVIQGDFSASYSCLMEIVDNIAKELEGLGIGAGQRIGLLFPNSIAYIAITYALWKLDAAVMPVDKELKESEIEKIIKTMGLAAMISFTDIDGGIRKSCVEIGTVYYFKRFPPVTRSSRSGKHVAFIRFTSGTTGTCKGVVLTHEKIIQRIYCVNKVLDIDSKDAILWFLPMAHHFVSTIILYLSKGAAIVLVNGPWTGSVLKMANRFKATILYASPFHYSLLANDPSGLMLPDVRLAISTTMHLPDAIYKKFVDRYGISIVQAYGIIEIGLICINTASPAEKSGSVGKVLPDYEIKIQQNAESYIRGRQSGEIFFRGPGFFDAYFDPWIDAGALMVDGWFETGDIGWIDDEGYVYICGRKNDVINKAGMKVFPLEIEDQLNSHPGISECCVYGIPHERQGEMIAADIVLDTGEKILTEFDIKAYCDQKMASYKIPEVIRIVGYLRKTPVTSKIVRAKSE